MFTIKVPDAKIGRVLGSLGVIHSWPYKISKSVRLIISGRRT